MSTAGLLRHLVGLGAAAVLIAAALALPALANPRAETVLAALPFNANEQRRILAGELVTTASAERTSDRELAITMAFLVAAPPTDLAARFERASAYELHDSARAWGS